MPRLEDQDDWQAEADAELARAARVIGALAVVFIALSGIVWWSMS